jgi:hypothetical protein
VRGTESREVVSSASLSPRFLPALGNSDWLRPGRGLPAPLKRGVLIGGASPLRPADSQAIAGESSRRSLSPGTSVVPLVSCPFVPFEAPCLAFLSFRVFRAFRGFPPALSAEGGKPILVRFGPCEAGGE